MTMPAYTDVTGLGGMAVALVATLLTIPGVRRISRRRLAGLLATAAILVLFPFGGLSVAAGVRGAFGDFSITTLVLLGCTISRCLTGSPRVDDRARWALLAFVSLAALALYPMALGVGMLDPYRLGYGSPWLVSLFFAVALAAWFWRRHLLAVCLALATLAWTLSWYESTNLWDYLLDPLVSFYALGCVVTHSVKRVVGSLRPGETEAAAAESATPR